MRVLGAIILLAVATLCVHGFAPKASIFNRGVREAGSRFVRLHVTTHTPSLSPSSVDAGFGFHREPSPLNIPHSGKTKGKYKFHEKQRPKIRLSKRKAKGLKKYKKNNPISLLHKGENIMVSKMVLPSATDSCICGSGNEYSKCCGILHQNVVPINNENYGPERILRARLSAFQCKMPHYLIDSTHPSNPDYIKFVEEAPAKLKSGSHRWTKEIMSMRSEYEFVGVSVVEEHVKGDTAQVIFRVLYYQEDEEEYVPVEEKAVFLRVGGRWLYQDGQTARPDDEACAAMLREWTTDGEEEFNQSLGVNSNGGGGMGALGRKKEKEKNDPMAPMTSPEALGGALRPKRVAASAGLNDRAVIRPFRSGRA